MAGMPAMLARGPKRMTAPRVPRSAMPHLRASGLQQAWPDAPVAGMSHSVAALIKPLRCGTHCPYR